MPIPIFPLLNRQEESLVSVKLLEAKLSCTFIDQDKSGSYLHDWCEYFRLLAKAIHGVIDDHLIEKIVVVYPDNLIAEDFSG